MTSLESQRLSSAVGELHVLYAHPSCLTLAEDGSKAVLRPNPVFLPKVLSSSHANQPLIITAFHPPPHSSQESRELHTLFPVRALIACLAATRTAHQTEQLFSCVIRRTSNGVLSRSRDWHIGLPMQGQNHLLQQVD